MRLLLLTMSFVMIAFTFSGCNTVEGFGRDVEKAGEKIQKM